MLAILDYKAGNQTSVRRALEHMSIPCIITNQVETIDTCDGIIFPGVGSAPQAMAELAASGMGHALGRAVEKGQPVLGICLGCQILLEESEEGPVKTLGLLPGITRLFENGMLEENGEPLKIPHMGWNSLERKTDCRLLKDVPADAEFYFVHSYYVMPAPEYVLATSRHGHEFCAIFGRDGLWGAQFHPEKSGTPGLRLLANFNTFCMEKKNAL